MKSRRRVNSTVRRLKYVNNSNTVWQRIRLPALSVVLAGAVLIAGNAPWGLAATLNLKYSPRIPWAPLLMGIYLALLWHYLNGAGWPHSTSNMRRNLLRAQPLSATLWRWSLLAGGSGVMLLWAVAAALMHFHVIELGHAHNDAHYPLVTVCSFILMNALVAGLIEEAAFRGYMQNGLEQRYGVTKAIIIVSVVFALSHLTHGIGAIRLAPLYIAVSIIYGILTSLTGSILPAATLHVSGDAVLFSLRYWQSDIGILVVPSAPNSWRIYVFAAAAALSMIFSVWAFRILASVVARKQKSSEFV
jgi:membrane protease YdiL (CAAX protease family)